MSMVYNSNNPKLGRNWIQDSMCGLYGLLSMISMFAIVILGDLFWCIMCGSKAVAWLEYFTILEWDTKQTGFDCSGTVERDTLNANTVK